MSKQLIFVTGGSGFLGSHIVSQLLENGYRVRAAARSPKISAMKRIYAKYGNDFETVAVEDITVDHFPDALQGVDAVIHSASPLAGRQPPAEVIKVAIEGTLNTVQQTQKAGIKRIVVTSSIVTAMTPSDTYTDQDWNPITKEQALNGDAMAAYAASKTLAEREVWALTEEHPDLDVTTLNPPFLYGPLVEGFEVPASNYGALSTDFFIYRLLMPKGVYPPSPRYADVRDVARAHVLALRSPPTSSVGRKRVIFGSPHGFNFGSTVTLIAEKRPELASRLTTATPPSFATDRTPVDFDRVQRVLGFKKEEFRAFEETILETVDALVALEKLWASDANKASVPAPSL